LSTREVMILGGYGTFGRRIARALSRSGLPVIIVGRRLEKAQAAATALGPEVRAAAADARESLDPILREFRPRVLINTCGPFQLSDYRCAEDCIRNGAHYIDLADGRAFVTGIGALDQRAKKAGLSVISGASTLPALSSAVLDHYAAGFARIDSVRCGITLGQKTERGIGATRAILSYIGRPLAHVRGADGRRYGWQGVYRETYPELGGRWMANCDVPDLDLLPSAYNIPQVQFSAGLENPVLHFGIWLAGWTVRLGLPVRWDRHASRLLRVSRWFDWLGTAGSGMHVIISGTGRDGGSRRVAWHIVAQGGDGSQIPCVPSVLLARDLAAGNPLPSGAYPCFGLISLEKYLSALRPFAVRTHVRERRTGEL
jgi:hypothetical protein